MSHIMDRPTKKDIKRLVNRAERVFKELDSPDVQRLRKDAARLAHDARDYARHAAKSAPSKKELKSDLSDRREQVMERATAIGAVVLPLVPTLARQVVKSRKTRRVVVVAPSVVARANPWVAAATVVGAGVVGYGAYKRWSKNRSVMADPVHKHGDVITEGHAVDRMDDEGPIPGAFDGTTALRISRN